MGITKKQFFLVNILIYSNLVFAQGFKQIFLGKDVNSYVGKYFRLESGAYLSRQIYNHKPKSPFEYNDTVYKEIIDKRPDSRYLSGYQNYRTGITDTNYLKNREFLVLNYSNYSGYSNYSLIELKDTTNHEILYFLYDSDAEYRFPFLIKGFSYSVDYLLKDIERDYDEIDSKTIYYSPSSYLSIQKIVKKNNAPPKYYLSLTSYSSHLSYNNRGITILFKDGTKWSKPNEKIDTDVDGSNFSYSAFISLTEQDLNLFSSKEIKKFRLYVYDNEPFSDFAEKFKYYVRGIRILK